MRRKSLFAKVLKRMVRASGLSQKGFAERISVTPVALHNWLNDQFFPRPCHIKAAVALVERVEGRRAVAALQAFYKMAVLPVEQVTPLYNKKMEPNIACYVFVPCWKRLFFERIPGIASGRTWQENGELLAEVFNTLLRSLVK